MKKIIVLALAVLLLLSALIALSSCKDKKESLINDLSVKFLTEEEYTGGGIETVLQEYDETAEREFVYGKKCYVVVEYTLVNTTESEDSVKTVISLYNCTADITVEEFPTTSYEMTEEGTIIAYMKLTNIGEEGKRFRYVISVIPESTNNEIKVISRVSHNQTALYVQSTEGKFTVGKDISVGSELEYRPSDDGTYYIVTGAGREATERITVPGAYNNIPIKEIAEDAFANLAFLEEIRLSEGIERIGGTAFKNCPALKSVFIPKSVTVIGESAFEGCTDVFFYCSALSRPLSWDEDFSSGNESVNFDADNLVFRLSDSKSYYTVSGKNYKGEKLFIPSTYGGLPVTTVEANGFAGAETLKSVTASCITVGSGAFKDCTALESITLKNDVLYIEPSAFSGCIALENVSLGGVKTVLDEAFKGCTSLSSMVIPASTYKLGLNVFSGCSALDTVTFENPTGWNITINESGTGAPLTPVDVTDPEMNVSYLKGIYNSRYWFRR